MPCRGGPNSHKRKKHREKIRKKVEEEFNRENPPANLVKSDDGQWITAKEDREAIRRHASKSAPIPRPPGSGLPRLRGVSEKQVAFGEDIRAKMLPGIIRELHDGFGAWLQSSVREILITRVESNTESRWWIGIRNRGPEDVAEAMLADVHIADIPGPGHQKKLKKKSVPKKYAYQGKPQGFTPDPSKKAPWED